MFVSLKSFDVDRGDVSLLTNIQLFSDYFSVCTVQVINTGALGKKRVCHNVRSYKSDSVLYHTNQR